MNDIQQRLAALAEWHQEEAKSFGGSAFHEKQAALLDKLAKAETRRSAIYIAPDGSLIYATALLIPEETK